MDGKEIAQVPRAESERLEGQSVTKPRRSRIPAKGAAARVAGAAIAVTALFGAAYEGAKPTYGAGETPTPAATATANLRVTETAQARSTQVAQGLATEMAAPGQTATAKAAQATSTRQAAETATAAPTPVPPQHEPPKNNYSWYTGWGLIDWEKVFMVGGVATAVVFAWKGLWKGVGALSKAFTKIFGKKEDNANIRGVGEDRRPWGIPGETERPQTPQPAQATATPVAQAPVQQDDFQDLAALLRGRGGNPGPGGGTT